MSKPMCSAIGKATSCMKSISSTSPDFGDGIHVDAEVLSRVATYIVNNTYEIKQTLASVIYLHDISVGKLGAVGQRNLRMLEKMIGIDKWNNCTLVTTK